MKLLMKITLSGMLSLALVFMTIPSVCADSTDDLILQLLVKKGLITQKEVSSLRSEIKKSQGVEIKGIDAISAHVEKAAWVEGIKFKGDVRLRNEYIKNTNANDSRTLRNRIRARLGLEAKISDTVKAGITLATGGIGAGSGTSTNQTLGSAFGTYRMNLDMAYINWKPINNVKVTGGKYKNPLYRPGDLLWDSDIRVEGASTNIKHSLDAVDLMLNLGVFQLDDIAIDKKNPYLYAVQFGAGTSIGDIADVKAYVGYLDFAKVEAGTSAVASGSADGLYDYNVVEASGEITFHCLEQKAIEPLNKPLTLFYDYAHNVSVSDPGKNDAWQIGAKLGKKPKGLGQWRLAYNVRGLERNSFLDTFPDGDSFGGGTNGYGHEVILLYGLAKNITFGLDYYGFKNKSVTRQDEYGHILQTDLIVKF